MNLEKGPCEFLGRFDKIYLAFTFQIRDQLDNKLGPNFPAFFLGFDLRAYIGSGHDYLTQFRSF